ncbi:MAG TPA: type II toxin-antitoxin system YafQ family toxin [Rhizomicrobium sp.]|jgi:mRNA interferase YafQ|nr:type II toxin-antitoxin system YafQ family toxin [Rhizomicrobium sp.]
MNSTKKPPNQRRAALPREVAHAKAFQKDWERYYRAGKYDLNRAKEVMMLLIANAGPLGAEWLEHPLGGDWEGFQECHIGGDFLLIYQLTATKVVFTRLGTHAELFE